jgi:hypothetical protein
VRSRGRSAAVGGRSQEASLAFHRAILEMHAGLLGEQSSYGRLDRPVQAEAAEQRWG